MTDWNIQSRAHACAACGKAFVDKEPYHTLLFDEKADFQRSDICEACWQRQYSQGARERKGFISYWQGIFEAPQKPADPILKETAESLLRKLIELNDPQYIPAAYILAVMLERKRVLRVKEQLLRDGQRVFIYEQPKSGDVFTIVDPNLQLNQLEQVQHDVATLLQHGLNATPEGLPVAAAPGPPSQDQAPGSAAVALPDLGAATEHPEAPGAATAAPREPLHAENGSVLPSYGRV
jgi:hypothetical protein